MIKNVIFIGSKDLGLGILEAIYKIAPDKLQCVVTVDDSKDTRCNLSGFKKFAQKSGKEIIILDKPSQLEAVISEKKPDFCVVSGWYWILKDDLLKKVRAGFVGLHPSLLPRYRGGAPLVWALINGEKVTGVSLFYFDSGMDTGDIVAQKKIKIASGDTVKNLIDKASVASVLMLKKNYPLLLKGCASRARQPKKGISCYPMRCQEDGKISWSLSDRQVYDFVRAQTRPYPGAFCFTDREEKIHIWSVRPVKASSGAAAPGEIVRVTKNGIVVKCGRGAVFAEGVNGVFKRGETLK